MRRWCWRRLGPSTTRTRRRRTTASSPPRGSQTPRPSGTTPCCWQSPRLSTSSRIKDRSLSLPRETQTSLPTGHIRSPFQFYQYLYSIPHYSGPPRWCWQRPRVSTACTTRGTSGRCRVGTRSPPPTGPPRCCCPRPRASTVWRTPAIREASVDTNVQIYEINNNKKY